MPTLVVWSLGSVEHMAGIPVSCCYMQVVMHCNCSCYAAVIATLVEGGVEEANGKEN